MCVFPMVPPTAAIAQGWFNDNVTFFLPQCRVPEGVGLVMDQPSNVTVKPL